MHVRFQGTARHAFGRAQVAQGSVRHALIASRVRRGLHGRIHRFGPNLHGHRLIQPRVVPTPAPDLNAVNAPAAGGTPRFLQRLRQGAGGLTGGVGQHGHPLGLGGKRGPPTGGLAVDGHTAGKSPKHGHDVIRPGLGGFFAKHGGLSRWGGPTLPGHRGGRPRGGFIGRPGLTARGGQARGGCVGGVHQPQLPENQVGLLSCPRFQPVSQPPLHTPRRRAARGRQSVIPSRHVRSQGAAMKPSPKHTLASMANHPVLKRLTAGIGIAGPVRRMRAQRLAWSQAVGDVGALGVVVKPLGHPRIRQRSHRQSCILRVRGTARAPGGQGGFGHPSFLRGHAAQACGTFFHGFAVAISANEAPGSRRRGGAGHQRNEKREVGDFQTGEELNKTQGKRVR